jgi:REP element-mobilizing transposase RayT
MARSARQYSNSGVYHIMFRGVNHEHLFENDWDYVHLREILADVKDEYSVQYYAYCMMDNHVHLLIKEQNTGQISQVMHKVLTRYSLYFNKKYERSGNLIGDRYKSKIVDVDEYFIPLLVYIHRNPLTANIVKVIEAYPYSSYLDYVKPRRGMVTDVAFVQSMLSRNEFIEVHTKENYIDFDEQFGQRRTMGEVLAIIKRELGDMNIFQLTGLELRQRNRIIRRLRLAGLSVREIERGTGISRGVIQRVRM